MTEARDLCDLSATAGDIAIDMTFAGTALGDAFEGLRDEAGARRGALALLYSAREGLADLIAEVEAMNTTGGEQ
jgi:hypothetical protein